jgi:hypothetical protein
VKNPIASSYVRHIDVAYHLLRDEESAGCIELACVPSSENTADMFTKLLNHMKLAELRGALGLMSTWCSNVVKLLGPDGLGFVISC